MQATGSYRILVGRDRRIAARHGCCFDGVDVQRLSPVMKHKVFYQTESSDVEKRVTCDRDSSSGNT